MGFTLIEMVIVIVLLATLAVLAAPKYVDISSDAKKAVMDNVAGTMRSAMAIIYSKAVVENQLGATGQIRVFNNTQPITLVYGYPNLMYGGGSNINEKVAELKLWMDIDIVSGEAIRANPDSFPDNTFTLAQSKNRVQTSGDDKRGVQIFFADAIKVDAGGGFECVVQYTNATESQPPKVIAYTDDC